MANTQEYNEAFNPFSDERQNENMPDFSGSRLVLEDSSFDFDMTEFHISFDEGTRLRKSDEIVEETNLDVEVGIRPSISSVSDQTPTESAPVLQQPRREDLRKAIPVYTVGWTSTSNSQFLAITGLDFLTGVHQVLLQQTVTSLSSPNQVAKRYIIKVPNGETLYSTVENSTELQRFCFGSQRGFKMSILDQTQQEAATLARTIGCVCGWFPCILQELGVYTPDNVYLGKVRQDPAFNDISFTVKERNGQDLYRIFGPSTWAWSIPLETKFVVAGGNGGGRLGTIIRQWNDNLGDFNLSINFPASGTPNEQKILLVGAALLIEYIFYEHRKTSCFRIC